MDNQKQQAAERIKQANNILVTVSNNPSVDQLAACIGLTLSLNKMGKHATAVFSGQVPSTLEFLQPEKTIERNTDSLRDFIIALDKSKADKLRYKVEDKMVRIFITPYRTSINEKDLEFSQGDFNVDVVVALGVHNQADLDQAITTHGRILHDAVIITLNVKPGGELGTINWLDPNASSLSELGVQLIDVLDKRLMDGQIATSFLTGIVAETDRFSNSNTSPQTMSLSAELMSAGANQQLVATKLEEPAPAPPQAPLAKQGAQPEPEAPAVKKPDDGTLEITHEDKPSNKPEDKAPKPLEIPEIPEEKAESATPTPPKPETPPPSLPEPVAETPPPSPEPETPQVHIDEHGTLAPIESEVADADEALLPPVKPHAPPTISKHNESPKMVLEPPAMGEAGLPGIPMQEGGLPPSMREDLPSTAPTPTPSAQADEPQNAPGTSFLGDQPLLASEPPKDDKPVKMPDANETLTDIERDVHSSHLDEGSTDSSQPASLAPPFPPASPTPVPVISPTAPAPAAPATPADNMPSGMTATPAAPAFSPPAPAPTPFSAPAPAAPVTTPSFGPAPAPPNPEPSLVSPVPEPPLAPASDNSGPTVDSARDAVAQAISGGTNQPLEPIQALNSQPVNLPFGANANDPAATPPAQPWTPPNDDTPDQNGAPVVSPAQPANGQDQNAPPPVPPPMIPPAPA